MSTMNRSDSIRFSRSGVSRTTRRRRTEIRKANKEAASLNNSQSDGKMAISAGYIAQTEDNASSDNINDSDARSPQRDSNKPPEQNRHSSYFNEADIEWTSGDDDDQVEATAKAEKSKSNAEELSIVVEESAINNDKKMAVEKLPETIESRIETDKEKTEADSQETTPLIAQATITSDSNNEIEEEYIAPVGGSSRRSSLKTPPPTPRRAPDGNANESQANQSPRSSRLTSTNGYAAMKEHELSLLHYLCDTKMDSFTSQAYDHALSWFEAEIFTKILEDDFGQISALQDLREKLSDLINRSIQKYKTECLSCPDQDSITLYQTRYKLRLKAELEFRKELVAKKFVSKLEKDSAALKGSQRRLRTHQEEIKRLTAENKMLKEIKDNQSAHSENSNVFL